MAFQRDTSADQSRFNGPDCVFRFDARTLYAHGVTGVPTTVTTRLTTLGSCKLARERERRTASERNDSISSLPCSPSSDSSSSESTASRVSETSNSSYRAFSRRLRELIREQTEEYMRRRRSRRAQQLQRHQSTSSSTAVSSSTTTTTTTSSAIVAYRKRDRSTSDGVLEIVRHDGRARLTVRYLGRCLARLDRRLRDILRDWQDRDSARYRALVRLKRAVRFMRVPLYAGMTLVGLYTSLAHLLAVEEQGALIFSATLYHLLNGSHPAL